MAHSRRDAKGAQGGAWGNACICPPTLRRGHSGSATEKRLGRPWGGVKVYRSVGDAEGHPSIFTASIFI